MELWDIITADGSPTGRTMVRGANTLKSGEYHLVVHIWPLNDYGSILIQKRTKTKKPAGFHLRVFFCVFDINACGTALSCERSEDHISCALFRVDHA